MRAHINSLNKLRCYIRKYSLNAKESSKGRLERTKTDMRYRKQKSKMADINPVISIIALSVNGLNKDYQNEFKKIKLYITVR